MRWLVAVLFLADAAHAHGCAFTGPSGGVPPGLREPQCTCAEAPCKHLRLRSWGEDIELDKRAVRVEELQRYGDLARVKITVTWTAIVWRDRMRSGLVLRPTPLLSVESCSVQQGKEEQKGCLCSNPRTVAQVFARVSGGPRALLWSRSPETHEIWVQASRKRQNTVFVLEGLALVRPPRAGGIRLYRSGRRVLAVASVLGRSEVEGACFVDRRYGRALFQYSISEARKRFGDRVAKAPKVNGLDELCAMLGSRNPPKRMFVANVTKPASLPDPPPPPPPPPPPQECGGG